MTSAAAAASALGWSAVAVYVIDKLAQINTVKNGETTTMVISLRIVIVTRSFSSKVRAEKKMDPYLELWSSGEEEEVAPVGTCSNYIHYDLLTIACKCTDRFCSHNALGTAIFTSCFFGVTAAADAATVCSFYSTTQNNIFSLSIPHFTVQCNCLSLAQV